MKFSFVIPLFNKQSYIHQTISSALAQRYQDFEMLIVDDGSTDESIEVVNSIKDSRIRIVTQKNAGVSVARNRGIHEANGEWICFLDADDWQHPSYLEKVVELINMFPHVDAVATRFKRIPDSEHWSPEIWPLQPPHYEIIDNLPKRWMQGIPFFTGSIVIRKALLSTLNPCFPVGESCGEDLDLWFRVAEKTSIALLDQPLVAYRAAGATSLSANSAHGVHLPYVARMLQRSPLLPQPLRKSTMQFIAHEYITHARINAGDGKRRAGIKELMKVANTGIGIRRWWVTLLMLLVLPKSAISGWQKWRESLTHG